MRFLTILTAVLAVCLASPALAQEATGGIIDFKPILNELMLALAAALSAGALYLLKLARDWFKAKTGVELQVSDEQIRRVLDRAIKYGIALAVEKWGKDANIRVSNAQVAQIANYVIAAVPDALAQFGITPERLQDMIRARLTAWSDGKVNAEPAVPSAPVVATPTV